MDLSGYSRSLLAAALLAIAVAPSVDAQTPLPGQRAVTRTKTLATPAGPAPFDVRVTPQSPIKHTFQWALVANVAGFRVFKSVNGVWSAQCAGVCPLTGTSKGFSDEHERWVDNSLVKPGTLYRFTWVYLDGREGSTDFTYANPPQPQPTTGFTAQKVGPGAVSLSWQPVPYAAWYRIFGTGMPAEGMIVQTTSTTLTNLRDGTYTWQLSADYGGVHGAGPSASIVLSSTGRYRVVANGFRVASQTGVFLSKANDGQNDEVYAGFSMFHVGRPQGQLLDSDLRQTQVHGEVSRDFPDDRVQAGTASLSGGLRTGDVFPSIADPSQRVGTIGNQSFPFLVWDGFLTERQDAVIVLPTIWESDGDDQAYTNWFLSEKSMLPQIWGDLQVQQALGGNAITLVTPPAWTYFGLQLGTMDHPLGSMFDLPQGSIPGEVPRRLMRRVIVITREMIEAALSGGSTGIVAIPMTDGGASSPIPFGSYTLYLQVERVP